MRTFIGLLGLAATLCAAQQPLIQSANAPDEVSFSQIEIGTDSPIRKSGVTVITGQDQWIQFLKKMDEESLKRPKIDWTKFQIVVATLEGSNTDGGALQVARLHKLKSGNIDIEFSLSKDRTGSGVTDVGVIHNTLSTPQYPYAILQTSIVKADWDIKVLD